MKLLEDESRRRRVRSQDEARLAQALSRSAALLSLCQNDHSSSFHELAMGAEPRSQLRRARCSSQAAREGLVGTTLQLEKHACDPLQLADDLVDDTRRLVRQDLERGRRAGLVPPDEDDGADAEDEDGEVVEAGREEVEVAHAGLQGEAELRRELGEEGEDRVEDAGRRRTVLRTAR